MCVDCLAACLHHTGGFHCKFISRVDVDAAGFVSGSSPADSIFFGVKCELFHMWQESVLGTCASIMRELKETGRPTLLVRFRTTFP